jgi:hypothetical protein
MSDDRLFGAFRTFGRQLEPMPDFADRLFEVLLAEAGLVTPGRARARWSLRLPPFGLRIPASGWRLVLLLVLLALLSLSIAIAGALLLRERQPFLETRVEVVDVTAPEGWSIDTLASEGDVGAQPALAYGPDGIPVVAHYDRTAGRVSVARCADSACSALGPTADAGPAVTNVLSAGYIAVGPEGEVWVGRTIQGAAGDLEIELQRVCPDPASNCEGLGPTDLGPGMMSRVRIRSDGRPVVLFGPSADGQWRLLLCGDGACQVGNSITALPVLGPEADVVLTGSGLPMFVASRNESLDLISCRDDACTRTATTPMDAGRQPRIGLDSRGRPVIAAIAGRSVVLYRCDDATCSGGTKSTLADLGPPPTGADETISLDLEIAPGDRPFVSLGAGGELQLFACRSSECSEATRLDLDATSPALAAPQALGLDVDGLPFVVYGVRSDLKVARCLEPDCLAPSASAVPASPTVQPTTATSPAPGSTVLDGLVRTVIGTPGGFNPAVTVGADGLPVAVYRSTDLGPAEVHVLHCGDARCTTGNTVATMPPNDPYASAIAIGPDGLPVVAYTTDTGNLSVARCHDPACADASVAHVLDGVAFEFVALAVPSDDRPLIAFFDESYELQLARCSTPSCTSAVAAAVDANSEGSVPNSLELRVADDGASMFGYAFANGEARIARCSDLDCSELTVTTAGTEGNDMITAALGVGSDDIPVLAFYSDGSLQVARCRDEACTAVSSVRVDAATAGWWTPIGVGFDERGFPLIAYFSPTNRDTKLARCHDVSCSSADLIAVDASDAYGADDGTGVAFLPDGSPVFIYARDAVTYAEVCIDPQCGG